MRAASAAQVYARNPLGSLHDYVNIDPDFRGAYDFPLLGIAVKNGAATLNGHQFDGVEIIGVVAGSSGATAGLRGRQEWIQGLMTAGILVVSVFFPPAILAAEVLDSSEIGAFHELIIAVDGVRVHDVMEFGGAANRAEPGEILYLTVVSRSRRKQIQMQLPRQ